MGKGLRNGMCKQREEKVEEHRLEMCYMHVSTPLKQSNHYVLIKSKMENRRETLCPRKSERFPEDTSEISKILPKVGARVQISHLRSQ